MGMSNETRRSQLTVKTFDRLSLNYKKSAQCLRDSSPDPYNNVATSNNREQIYLKLLQGTSGLDTNDIFQGAPSFFKKKIGLKENGFVGRDSRRALELKAPQSDFRLKNCTGCSSTEIHQDSSDDSRKIRGREQPSRKVSRGELSESTGMEEKFFSFYTSHPSKASMKPEWKSVWNNSNAKPKGVGNDLTARDATQIQAKMKKAKAKEVCTIFAVNGNVVSLPGIGCEHFTNWFGQADPSDPARRRSILRKLDFSGYADRDISLKVFEGRKFVIEASKSGLCNKSVKHSFKLQEDMEVESLFLSRDKQGYLIIEKKVNMTHQS